MHALSSRLVPRWIAMACCAVFSAVPTNAWSQTPLPTLSVENKVIVEGNSGQSDHIVVVRISAGATQPVTFSVTTTPRTATGANVCGLGQDFLIRTTSLSFSPTDATRGASFNVPIMVCGDEAIEGDETFAIVFSNVVNATVAGEGTVTISDNDQIRVGIEAQTETVEGSTATHNVEVAVGVSFHPVQPVSVQYATSDSNATGGSLCTGNVDYIATSGTMTFQPNDPTGKKIVVSVCGDAVVDQKREVFFVTLSNPVNAVFATSGGGTKARVTIVDDDRPRVTVADATIPEGNNGPSIAQITVSLSHALTQQLILGYETPSWLQATPQATGGGTCAGGADFVTITGAAVIFNPGEVSKTVTVTVCGDNAMESDERFKLRFFSPTADEIEPIIPPIITIGEDDFPTVAISDAIVNIRSSNTSVDAVFTLTLASGGPAQSHTVSWTTQNIQYHGGSRCTTDPTAVLDPQVVKYITTSGTVTFPIGVTQQTLTVKVCARDNASATNVDGFSVILSAPVRTVIGDGTGIARIQVPPS